MKTKNIQWKVGNLRDISDHGLAIQFADQAKAAFIAELFGKDGETRIEAGKSYLTIDTVGRVARTHFYSAIGNGFNTVNIHYYSDLENLNFTEKNNENTDALQAAVFGNKINADRWHGRGEMQEHSMASILRPLSGVERDKFTTWQAKNVWALAGETGLRAKAVEMALASAKTAISNIESNIEKMRNEKDRHAKRDYNDARHTAKTETKSILKKFNETEKTDMEKLGTCLAKISNAEKTIETLSDFQVNYDSPFRRFCQFSRIFNEKFPTAIFFPSGAESFSHPIIRANYIAKSEGENLILSSGVICPFTKSDALAWLKGEKNAPFTRYGLPTRVEGCDLQGNALTLIKCGCHLIDVARDLGGEFTDLLKPIHTIVKVEKQDEFALTPDNFAEFAEKLKAVCAAKNRENRHARLDAITRFREKMAQIQTLEANHKTDKIAFDTKIANLNEEKMKAEKALAAKAFTGASLESVFASLRSIVNVLNPSKL